MNISVIIPNYNGADLLEKNLPFVIASLNAYHDGEKEIVIADDSSFDNSIEIARKVLSKNVSKEIAWNIIKNSTGKNRGFSSNVNVGVEMARGDILVLINTDVRPDRNFLKPLLKHFTDDTVFAVGCMDKSIENEKVVLRGRGLGSFQKGFLTHRAGDIDLPNTLWVSGGSGAFRKDIWNKLRGLNPLYNPFYWEDIDLSYRAQKMGNNVLFEKESVVVHEHSKGSVKKTYNDKQIKIIAYRNQFFFVWLNITDFDLLIDHLIWLPYHLLSAVKNGNINFLIGFMRALLKFPVVFVERKKNKKEFIVTDKEILKRVTK